VFRACQPVDDFDGIFTDFATRAEHFNFVFQESVLATHPARNNRSLAG
jgi:hypothetical protein